MKRITLFLFFCVLAQLSIAANLIVAGNLSDQDGNPAAGSPIEINILTGNNTQHLIMVNTDAQGNFSVETDIQYDAPGIWVKVFYVDCNGERKSEFQRPQPSSNSNVLFFKLNYCNSNQNHCKVQVKLSRDSSDAAFLHAVAHGSAPFTYLWSTGDTTEVIPYPGPGRHCVTVTDSKNCTAEACFMQNSAGCKVTITVRRGNVGTQLTALTAPPIGGSYLWNTGDTTKSIIVLKPGNYCVTVTFPNGCTASACNLDHEPPHECIRAVLGVEYDSVPSATLTVIHDDTLNYNYIWNTGETTQSINVTQSGLYKVLVSDPDQRTCRKVLFTHVSFDNKCEARIKALRNSTGYVLVAVPIPPNSQVSSYLWSTGATTESIQVADLSEEHCVTIVFGNCSAEACIGGTNGGIQGDIKVQRSINNDGTIILKIRNSGKIIESFWAEGIENELLVSEAGTYTAIGVDTKGSAIFLPIVIENNQLISFPGGITVFPTITDGELNIRWPKSVQNSTMVQVYNMNGKVVHQFILNEQHSGSSELWNTSGLPSGLYIMNASNAGQNLSARFIKK
jgi:hypothetical protein